MTDGERPVAEVAAELGLTMEHGEHDRVTEMLVLCKIVDMRTGDVALTVASNDLDWIAQAGLVAAYGQIADSNPAEP